MLNVRVQGPVERVEELPQHAQRGERKEEAGGDAEEAQPVRPQTIVRAAAQLTLKCVSDSRH